MTLFNCRARGADHDPHPRGREFIESIWQECAPYLDYTAPQRAPLDLHPVFWEMYLAYALKRAGIALVPRENLGLKNNRGPDLFAEKPDVWIEAVMPMSGEGMDGLHEPGVGEANDVPNDAFVLRYAIRNRGKGQET